MKTRHTVAVAVFFKYFNQTVNYYIAWVGVFFSQFGYSHVQSQTCSETLFIFQIVIILCTNANGHVLCFSWLIRVINGLLSVCSFLPLLLQFSWQANVTLLLFFLASKLFWNCFSIFVDNLYPRLLLESCFVLLTQPDYCMFALW